MSIFTDEQQQRQQHTLQKKFDDLHSVFRNVDSVIEGEVRTVGVENLDVSDVYDFQKPLPTQLYKNQPTNSNSLGPNGQLSVHKYGGGTLAPSPF